MGFGNKVEISRILPFIKEEYLLRPVIKFNKNYLFCFAVSLSLIRRIFSRRVRGISNYLLQEWVIYQTRPRRRNWLWTAAGAVFVTTNSLTLNTMIKRNEEVLIWVFMEKKKLDISLKKKTKIIRKVDAKISSPLAIKKKTEGKQAFYFYKALPWTVLNSFDI